MSYDTEAPLSETWVVTTTNGNPDDTRVVKPETEEAKPAALAL